MRTTVRVDDDLLEEVRTQARRERVSLTRMFNRVLKAGLRPGGARRPATTAYRERVHAMGVPRVPLDKALGLAAAIEDEEIVRELMARK